MKKFNLFLLIAAVILLITNLSYSQNNGKSQKSPEVRAREITDKLDLKLTLNNSKDTLVYNAYKDFYNTLSSFYNENSQKNKDEMRQVMENVRKDLDTKMSIILTPDQMDKYKQFQQDMDKNKNNSKRKKRDQ